MLYENRHRVGGLVQRNGRPLFRVLQIIVKLYNIWKNLGDGEGGVSLEWMKSGQWRGLKKGWTSFVHGPIKGIDERI